MAEDSTRRLLKTLGMAVTDFEDAVSASDVTGARKAEAELRPRLQELIALIEGLSERAATLP